MYCKHCGKQIADDSSFCQYCGGKVDAQILDNQQASTNPTEKSTETEQQSAQEVIVTTKDDSAIQVEITKKSSDNSSTIANEIVGNMKMIGLALVCWVVFMVGFIAIHQKDIQKHPGSYWGESCYDESVITGNYGSFDWKEILSEYQRYRANEKRGLNWDGSRQFSKLPFKLYDQSDEELEKKAKEEAERNKANFSDCINSNRQWRYEDDRKEKLKYSAIILLAFFIVGRYLVKLIKWVGDNKTE